MKATFLAALALGLGVVCGSAVAAPALTQQECHAYPFVRLSHPVTHSELMTELGELEAVGYYPDENPDNYPSDLNAAEKRLRKEYRQDCMRSPQS